MPTTTLSTSYSSCLLLSTAAHQHRRQSSKRLVHYHRDFRRQSSAVVVASQWLLPTTTWKPKSAVAPLQFYYEATTSIQRSAFSTALTVDTHESDDDGPHRPSPMTTATSTNSTHTDTTTVVDSADLASLLQALDKAAGFNQGQGGSPNRQSQGRSKRQWDLDFVRDAVDRYEHYLESFYQQQQQQQQQTPIIVAEHDEIVENMKDLFFSPSTTEHAFVALLRCRIPTQALSRRVRKWERYIGGLGRTNMTDTLSLHMLEAHGKAGNVGRAIQLLGLRKERGYPPTTSEFLYAIVAIHAAGLSLRKNRNVFVTELDQPQIDDPTRWLDAILLNMNQRGFELTTPMANRMLNTYASTGRSAKSMHFFYRVTRQPMEVSMDDDSNYTCLPSESVFGGEDTESSSNYGDGIATSNGRPVKIQLNMRPPPPYHKIPSQVRGKLVRKPGTEIRQLKLERESDPDWSPAMTSAISFADSLKQGACGHGPIDLDLISYTTLMKACVHRGSLWRAMHILDEVMPAHGIEPDIVSYNILLDGLARVGDVPTSKEYFRQLLSSGLDPTKETIEAIINGMLNLGDVGAAITFCQDAFNQHSVLPPYTTHLKILEFSLGRGLVFEAKRQLYFLQQLWKWKRNQYHSEEFCKIMEMTQKNPKISRVALEKVFAYFGEELTDADFL